MEKRALSRKLRSAGLGMMAILMVAAAVEATRAQEPIPPPMPPPVGGPGSATSEGVLEELQKLKAQVKELQEAKVQSELAKKKQEQQSEEVKSLQKELTEVKKKLREREVSPPNPPPQPGPPPPTLEQDPDFYSLDPGPEDRIPSGAAQGPGGGFAGPRAARFYQSPGPPGGKINDHFPLSAAYKWNFNGGYTSLATPDGEFVLNIQQLASIDSINYDRQNVLTPLSGFTIPNYRLYTYGNFTKNYEYQMALQEFAGSFNLIDLYLNVHYDDRIQFRIGRFLTPFLIDYYGQSPLFIPNIWNSPLYQLAGKRNIGAMVWGKLWNYKIQYQLGVFNGPNGAYFDLDRNKDFMGTIGITPFKGDGIPWLDSLGFQIGVQTGKQNYNLYDLSNPYLQNTEFPNGTGEPQLNRSWVTSNGIVFSQYDTDVRAIGNRTKIAPGFFWLGRASVSGEYLVQSWDLANSNTKGTSVQHGFYVRGSYFLTGERYNGDSTGLYSMISPIHPFQPTRGNWGAGPGSRTSSTRSSTSATATSSGGSSTRCGRPASTS